MKNTTHYLILCGGKGQRLWPLSRGATPKQIISYNNQRTLLESTVQRINAIKQADARLSVVTSTMYYQPIKTLLGAQVDDYIVEPLGKNTAPAITLAVQSIVVDDDPVLVFLPADHYIRENNAFKDVLDRAIEHAHNHPELCLIGVKPYSMATSYGYILTAQQMNVGSVMPVAAFVEKPPRELARKLLKESPVLWNCGIFVGKRSVFIQLLQTMAPELFNMVEHYVATKIGYEQVPNIQFDKLILEHVKDLSVVCGQFTWRDLGDLESFVDYATHDNTPAHQKNNISLHGANNVALSKKKMVAFLGVSDICLIETDDIILVKRRGPSEDVRDLISELEQHGFESLL